MVAHHLPIQFPRSIANFLRSLSKRSSWGNQPLRTPFITNVSSQMAVILIWFRATFKFALYKPTTLYAGTFTLVILSDIPWVSISSFPFLFFFSFCSHLQRNNRIEKMIITGKPHVFACLRRRHDLFIDHYWGQGSNCDWK